MSQLVTMFFTIFVAELGDKTQIATVLYAAERKDAALGVFIASASALVLGTAFAVCLGAFGGRWLENVPLKLIAARHPGVPLYIMGESMGGAVALVLLGERAQNRAEGTSVTGAILIGPAVRSRDTVGALARAGDHGERAGSRLDTQPAGFDHRDNLLVLIR